MLVVTPKKLEGANDFLVLCENLFIIFNQWLQMLILYFLTVLAYDKILS